jgi:hypothetical protein
MTLQETFSCHRGILLAAALWFGHFHRRFVWEQCSYPDPALINLAGFVLAVAYAFLGIRLREFAPRASRLVTGILLSGVVLQSALLLIGLVAGATSLLSPAIGSALAAYLLVTVRNSATSETITRMT